LRIRISRGFWTSKLGLGILGGVLAIFLALAVMLTYYYVEFGHMITQRLGGQIYQNTSRVYSAPERLYVGELLRQNDLKSYLVRAGYQDTVIDGSPGQYDVNGTSIEIRPSKESYFQGNNALRVTFSASGISRISQLNDAQPRDFAEIEPELITNLFDSSREKRRIVRFDDLPPIMVNSVLAAEDKRFFEHGALDVVRVFGAAFYDLSRSRKAQGASTIDMQVARTFFFTTKREWRRKMKEILMAAELDQRYSKREIFELYANDIYLGNRGSFSIRGFGEGAQAYFGKDVRELTVGEAAFLAGIIRAPNRYSNAEHHLDRAEEARNRVLTQLREDGYITPDQEAAAKNAKLKFSTGETSSSNAPFFVDMIRDHLLEKYSESELSDQSYRIYSTLDPALQHAATEAVQIGIANVDKLLAKKYALWKKQGQTVPPVQVALVAMDQRTGEIRALIGGRDYGESQLNHALAHRQPGSVFKPFVYAAAFDNAVQGLQPVVTPSTTVEDVPTTFDFDGKDYTPDNYGQEFYGTVTVRDALIHSLNVATIKVAEMVGYDRVVSVARQMGLGANIKATPAVALGAYEMTPVDVAGGYTAFAANGVRAEPLFIRSVVTADGKLVESTAPQSRPVLDPRVAFLTTSLMEDVINHGTGYPVRALGFNAPAAGKTGTSRDGWFAGYTSNLLCVVWVGFDDNRNLGLTGGNTAGPIWGEFMKRAVREPAYRNTQPFSPPDGVMEATVDPDSGQLATATCPKTQNEYFIEGTQPTQYCQMHGGAQTAQSGPIGWLSHLFGKGEPAPPPAGESAVPAPAPANPRTTANAKPAESAAGEQEQPEKKKGVLGKIFGIFGGGNKKPEDSKQPHQ
jgi:penicillin-binding protein 1B